MSVDFAQIKSGEDFELLCEDLLQSMGLSIEAKVARGPDLGKDIIATQIVTDRMGFSEKHRYLIECKHYAGSGKSVQEIDIGSPVARMGNHNCDRYILVTSTVPSEKVRAQLTAISNIVPHYQATTWSKGDLIRLLDKYPEVRDRYFPPMRAPTPSGTLAETVEGLLTVMGFDCKRHKVDESQVRLVCIRKGAFARSVVVVCREGVVERSDVEIFFNEVKAQDLAGGVLVTHSRVSPAAMQQATETGGVVKALTLDDLYRELIDFEPYARSLVTAYEEDELSTYYVDLGCKTKDDSTYKPIDSYIDSWLDDPSRNHISILGDYGTGKTSFCRQYAAKLARRWLNDPDRSRIPILISLRDYAKAMSLEQLITDFLVNRCGIQAGYDAFRRFNADGRLVLMFDGFDEMAQKVDTQITVDNFEELARAVEARSKVILTCRGPYFRTRREAEALLQCKDSNASQDLEILDDLPNRPAIDLTHRPNFEILSLLPFDQDDIKAMLRARFPAHWHIYWNQIWKTYNLPELARRPVLLDMIAQSLRHLKPGQVVNAARLYEAYTDLWLVRDEEKGRKLITRTDKKLFMQELALEMLRRETLSIHYSRLPEKVRIHFHLEKAQEIDYFEHDIRTCSFLNRDDEGYYQFVHKSFLEFFVAQWLAPRLLDGNVPEITINEEVCGFVQELLEGIAWPPPPPDGINVPEGMIWVPSGPFITGGKDEVYRKVVRINHSFLIARTPVTNAEYAHFVEATGYRPPGHWMNETPVEEQEAHPVVSVSWNDAIAYAKWAGARLVTEEEWEKAARGIDGRIYPWGNEIDPSRCNMYESGIGTTTPVNWYSPDSDSPCGCKDMVGNVWEWTASEWDPTTRYRVLRGGAFNNYAEDVHIAARRGASPELWSKSYGFRIGMSVPIVSVDEHSQ